PGGTSEVRVSQDNHRLSFGSMDTSGMALAEFDMASRQTRPVSSNVLGIVEAPHPYGARGLASRSSGGKSVAFVDSAEGRPRILTAPDSLQILDFDLSADAQQVAVVVQGPTSVRVGITPTAQWAFR